MPIPAPWIRIEVAISCRDCEIEGEGSLTDLVMELPADKWTGKLHLDALKAMVDKHTDEKHRG